jgi:phage baseplate assembly protein W
MSLSQFNFKSSGTKKDNRRYTKEVVVARPIGIVSPMNLGDDIFKMHTNPVKQLADNFRNLVLTNYGERLGKYNFGTNLKGLVYEYSNQPDFDRIASQQIEEAVQKFIPQIKIKNVTSELINTNEKNILNDIGLAKVTIRIIYFIPALNSKDLGLEVDFYLGG